MHAFDILRPRGLRGDDALVWRSSSGGWADVVVLLWKSSSSRKAGKSRAHLIVLHVYQSMCMVVSMEGAKKQQRPKP